MHKSLDNLIALSVDELDHAEFFPRFLANIRSVFQCDLSMISLYRGNEIRELICERDSPLADTTLNRTYTSTTYRHNPFFHHYRRGLSTGVYRMRDLAAGAQSWLPSGDSDALLLDRAEEIGYITHGWPARLRELDIALNLNNGGTVQIALFRENGQGFAAGEILSLSERLKTLTAIFNRRLSLLAQPDSPWSGLSAREGEIVRLMLEGLEEKPIAERLGITAETVKTHRRKAYLKLGVDSRTGLFLKALRDAGRTSADR